MKKRLIDKPIHKPAKKSFKKKRWPKLLAMGMTAVLLVVSLALVLVEKLAPDQTYIPQNIVRIPSRIVAAAMQPLQSAFAWAGNAVSGYFREVKLRENIEIAYNELKAENDKMVYESLLNQTLREENERLKLLWDESSKYREKELTPILAHVTAKETGNWFQMFTIDVGARDGVKENMAVVNVQGLIGYIYKVYDTAAEVISIIDSRAGVAGIIQSSRDQGVVKGTLGIGDEPTCRMYYLPVDLSPRPGDLVVTSGIGMPFPQGLEIGVVRESTRYMDENKHYVVIEPNVDFMHLEEVMVLLYDAKEQDMPENANDGQIRYVPVPLDTMRPIPVIGEQVHDPNLGAVTPPPRATRLPSDGSGTASLSPDGPAFTLEPGASPTPNPELDELMAEEMAEEGD